MVERYQSRLASIILQCIHKELFKCLGPKSRKLVMEKVFANPTFQSCLPDYFILKKLVITTKELLTRMCVSLQETKSSNSNVKLVTKCTILTIIMSVGASNYSNMARVLGIHPRNIVTTMVRQFLTCDSGIHMWRLSLRKKRFDIILHVIRNAIVQWWTKETHVTLNKNEVTRKRSGPNICDEKATHFLMETHVHIYF
jgi:hypothetical protein